MKRRPMRRPLSRADYETFFTAVSLRQSYRCYGCAIQPQAIHKCMRRSAGQLDAHHLIPQRALRRELEGEQLHAALTDPRNGVIVGRYHHDALEACYLRPERDRLPSAVHAFAADFNIVWLLERLYANRVERTA